MRKRICFATMMMAAMLLSISCKANKPATPDASGVAKVEKVKSDFAFLKKLGIDPTDSLLMDERLETAPDKIVMLGLEENQRKALLKGVFEGLEANAENELDYGAFYIIGVRALPGDYTLVTYHIEFGDGSSGMVGVYDKNGKLTDCVQVGPWQFRMPEMMNEDCTEGEMRDECNVLTFVSQNKFVVNRTLSRYEFKTTTSDRDEFGVTDFKKTKDLSSIVKEYAYTIDKNGRIKTDKPKMKEQKGNTPESLLIDEIEDLTMRPKYDENVYDLLNELAMRPLVQQTAGGVDDEFGYRLQGSVARLFELNPQDLLKWIAKHRDLKKNQVVTLFESLFSDGVINKYTLYQQIQKMPAGADKDYLEKLTGQWGPADAVG